jgi:uncharacterized membrane protein YphA (DoxX/SURF4 family)
VTAYSSEVVVLVSAALFLSYGFLCLFSDGMRAEFDRFGLARYRRLTGGLEVLGGVGLIVGLFFPAVMLIAATGLALLMLLGVIARVRVQDPFLEILPATILLVMNGYLVSVAWGALRAA